MDYETEFGKLGQGGSTFKPTVGQYNITILDEPEETTFKADDGTETPQIKLKIKHDKEPDKEFNWFIGKGITSASLFGQLMAIGKFKTKLKEENITLIVNTANNKNTYTIVEAASLIEQSKVEEETVVQ